jgi:hypothetical protein
MASHDLQFDVHNGDGRPLERGIRGEMDHLPPTSTSSTQSRSDGGKLEYIGNKLKESAHPVVIIFHILFKAAALFLYIFGGWIVGKNNGARFISLMVTCILLLAADFWVVKNVTGRLLVGLRWWNQVKEEETEWIFESAEDKVVNKFDRTVFWTVLYLTPVVWACLFVLGLLKFNVNWLLIVIMALSLNLANVYGYYKCSKEQAAQFQQMMQTGAQQGAMAMVRSNMLSVLTGTNMAAGARNNSFV